jgi:hypothetical protein
MDLRGGQNKQRTEVIYAQAVIYGLCREALVVLYRLLYSPDKLSLKAERLTRSKVPYG